MFENLIDRYAKFLGNNPWFFILAPLLSCAVLSSGLSKIKIETDIGQLYTPLTAPSHVEMAKRTEFEVMYNRLRTKNDPWIIIGPNDTVVGKHYFQYKIIYVGKTKAVNLLDPLLSDQIVEFDNFVRTNMTYTHKNQKYKFLDDFCTPAGGCPSRTSSYVELFFLLFNNDEIRNDRTQAVFSYPVMEVLGLEYYIAEILQVVQLDRKKEISGARVINTMLDIPIENTKPKGHVKAIQESLNQLIDQHNRQDKNFQIYLLTKELLEEELSYRLIKTSLPYVALSALLLFLFVIVSNYHSCMVPEAFAGIFSTILTVPTAFGLTFYLGIPFNAMVVVSPFLLLAIGVDDTFILIGAWRKCDDKSLTREERLTKTMKVAAPSVILTSLTDAASFGIGAVSQTPAVRVFCIFTALGIIIDFLFQVTLFPAMILILDRRKSKKQCERSLRQKIAFAEKSKILKIFSPLYVAKLLRNPLAKTLILLLYILYLAVSLYGCSKTYVSLEASKLLMDTSTVYPYFRLLDTDIWEERIPAIIFIRNCPDFRYVEEQKKFLNLAGTWTKRVELLSMLRRVIDKYPEYDCHSELDHVEFVDQVSTLGANTLQTVGIALLCMAVIALIFFRKILAAFWVFFSLLSIDAGVVGLLILWGADLDPMSMIDILMSVGFSIDFTAHFCFVYYEKSKESAQISKTLEWIGWPLTQCALSTLIAVLPACLIPAYIARTFFRTVTLVVTLGLLHALVVLPVILPLSENRRTTARQKAA